MSKKIKGLVGLLIALCIVFANTFSISAEEWKVNVEKQIEETVTERKNLYSNYKKNNENASIPAKEILISADSFSEQAPDSNISIVDELKGRNSVAVWGISPDYAKWNFTIPESGLYEIKLIYFPLKQTMRSIEIAIKIDGQFPFSEAASITLSSAYKSEYPIRQDELGNDYNSSQIEISRWYEESLKNDSGLQDNPYRFNLSAGEHVLDLYLLQETFALAEICLVPVKDLPTYEQYVSEINSNDTAKDFSKMYQAEEYSEKSHSSIMPQSNRNNSLNVPFSYSNIKLNIISGENWNSSGQWLQWNVTVPNDGWYTINFRYSQSYNKNLPVHRRIYIDGKVPFAEADCFMVPYEEEWGLFSFSVENAEEMRFWLTEGEHTVRLEAVLGSIEEIVSEIDNIVYDLSCMYQKINMIVGSSPDQYRDYNIDESIPNLLDTFKENSNKLQEIQLKLNEISGGKGTTAGIVDVLAFQLEDMIKHPSTIPSRAETLNSNISSLSSTGEELKSQAMDLDYIYIASPEMVKPVVKENFFRGLAREVMVFINSFVTDYNTFSPDKENESITVWVNSGRDQAQVINRMIKDMFVPNYGISVNLKLVDANLIQAFLSGNPPDTMIMMARGQPINLAIRGALADLSKMPDFDKVKSNFVSDALTPYSFNDGCYGLPDSQSYFMMFYRKDIFKELGLQVPQTWDELFDIMRILHINNMDVGLPYSGIDAAGAVDAGLSTTSIFSALLLQNGGKFYNDEGTKTALTTNEATKAFIQWTSFYNEYDLPLTYNFYNRFKTGTMPIGIANYTMYNQIAVAAPEIKNLWAMELIPGVKKSDGSIIRNQGASGTASVITSTSKHKEAAWKFLCWWTGEEAQTRYANDIESILGISARYPTANIKAFSNIQWSRSEYAKLLEQWDEVCEIPEIPGSYYTVRGIDNAFRSVILNSKNPKETLLKYSRDIDAEIKRKRGEFALDKQ